MELHRPRCVLAESLRAWGGVRDLDCGHRTPSSWHAVSGQRRGGDGEVGEVQHVAGAQVEAALLLGWVGLDVLRCGAMAHLWSRVWSVESAEVGSGGGPGPHMWSRV